MERLERARQRQATLQLDLGAAATVGDPREVRRTLSNKQHNFSIELRELFDDVHTQRMRLAGQIPPYPSPGAGDTRMRGMTTGTVSCVATFAVEAEKDKYPYPTKGESSVPVGAEGPPTTTTDGDRTIHGLEKPESRQTGAIGGYVFEGEKATASKGAEQRAEFVTRSTGDAAPDTHAEARLLAQVERMLAQGGDWKERVRTIEIHLSHSPCPGCTELLLKLYERLDNGKLRFAVVHWSNVYRHNVYPTTPADVRSLRRKYAVFGPLPT